jgi:hypothetical protein
MMQRGAWTFRYSLEGFLKRSLHSSEPKTLDELVDAVLREWAGPNERESREAIADRVSAALNARLSAFQKREDERFVLRRAASDELHDRAYAFLKEVGCPQKQGDILRHLQMVTGRGRGDLMSRINLDADARFVRLEGGEWLLSEWELLNDAIAALMVELGQRRAQAADLIALVVEEDAGRMDNAKFLPELDPRFTAHGDAIECLLVEPEAAAAVDMLAGTLQEDTEKMEEQQMNATETITHTEEKKIFQDIPTTELVQTALRLLTDVSAELQGRVADMPKEVLELFNLEDLHGIENLMQQRKRLEALSEDLQRVVAKWSEGAGV